MRTDRRPDAASRSAKGWPAADDGGRRDGGRQDGAENDDPRTDRPERSLPRRSVLVSVAGVIGGPAIGSVRGEPAISPDAVDVAATEPYRVAVERAARAFEGRSGGVDVRVRRADPKATAMEGDASPDVFVSGRPSLGSEGRLSDRGQGVAVAGVGALSHSQPEWRTTLSRSEVRDRWAADRPIEAWSESDRGSVARVVREGDTLLAGEGTGERTILVRGRRDAQYARGFGGVAYYEADPTDVAVAERRRARGDSYTPLVRLAYVGPVRTQVDGPANAFGRFLADQVPLDGLTYFADPSIEAVP